MTTVTDFDRLVASWLETDGPADLDQRVLEASLATARRTNRRRGVNRAVFGPTPWPSHGRTGLRSVAPAVRVAIVAVILALVTVGAMLIGSRLVDQRVPPPSSLDGRFVALDPVPDRMDVAAAVALPDGRVLLAGPQFDGAGGRGQNSTGWFLKVWDPASGTFVTYPRTSQLPIGNVAPLADGRVLIIDAWAGPLDPMSSAELFDPATGSFGPARSMSVPRGGLVSARLADGRILVTGGEPPEGPGLPPGTANGEPALSSAELFDPSTAAFEPTGPMTTGRIGHGAVTLEDGRVLVVGGTDGSFEGSHPLDSAEIYDPSTGTFAPTGRMVAPMTYFQVAPTLLADGRVLLFGEPEGGYREVSTGPDWGRVPLQIFDPATGTFTAGGYVPHAVSTATVLDDGLVLLTGTWQERTSAPPGSQDRVRTGSWAGIFDPASGSTREIPPPEIATQIPYSPPQVVRLRDGRALFAQGWDPNDDRSPEGLMSVFVVPDQP